MRGFKINLCSKRLKAAKMFCISETVEIYTDFRVLGETNYPLVSCRPVPMRELSTRVTGCPPPSYACRGVADGGSQGSGRIFENRGGQFPRNLEISVYFFS